MPLPTDPNTTPIWTPASISAYARMIGNAIVSLNQDIIRLQAQLDGGFLAAWQTFAQNFNNFASNLTAIDMGLGSTPDTLERFAAQYNGFEEGFVQSTGEQPSRPSPQESDEGSWGLFGWAWRLALVGLAGYGAYRLYQAAQEQDFKLPRPKKALGGLPPKVDSLYGESDYYLEIDR